MRGYLSLPEWPVPCLAPSVWVSYLRNDLKKTKRDHKNLRLSTEKRDPGSEREPGGKRVWGAVPSREALEIIFRALFAPAEGSPPPSFLLQESGETELSFLLPLNPT